MKRANNTNALPSVLVVIINWNGKKDIIQCLVSIRKQNYPTHRYKILVVDNASKDGSQTKIEQFMDVKLIKNRKNMGYVNAVNQGIRYSLKSKYDYTWILNNDVVVDKNALINLVKTAVTDEEIGVIGPLVYSYNHPSKIDNVGYNINLWTGYMRKLKYGTDVFKSSKRDFCDVTTILGCSNLVRNSVFRKTGLFKPIYELYFEETDFNFRVKQSGFRVVVVRLSKVWHKDASTMDSFKARRGYLLLRNLFIFELLNARWWHLLVFVPYYFLIHIPAFLIKGCAYCLKLSRQKL